MQWTDGADGAQGPTKVLDKSRAGPGADGQDGADGAQGPQGADGQDGADGAQGPARKPGADGQDGADGAQGPQGQPGTNGQDGADGIDGSNALIATSNEPAGANCANGGVKIEAGVDDNGNGQLESNEVDSTQYICDGGSTVNTMLTTVIEALSTTEWAHIGGSEISHGLDNGDGGGTAANGQLESGEVDYSTSFCTNMVASMMINTHPNTQFVDTTDSIYASVAVGSDLFIVVDNPLSGSDLLISSNGKTGLVKTFDSLDSSTLTEFGNKLYFSAADANGCTLWESDGTPSGTAMVKDTDPSSTSNSNCPEKLTVVGSIGFFTGYDSTNGEALWKTDGTTAGTVMVKDTYTTGMTNGPARLTKVGNIILLWLRQHCRGFFVEE